MVAEKGLIRNKYSSVCRCVSVGRQWLALYAAKNESTPPILASSLKAVVGSEKVPENYTTGIHMFGSDAAFNLNDTRYVRNNKANKVYVYYNTEQKAATPATGSVTTTGYRALAVVPGLIVGILGTVGITAIVKKNKKKQTKE